MKDRRIQEKESSKKPQMNKKGITAKKGAKTRKVRGRLQPKFEERTGGCRSMTRTGVQEKGGQTDRSMGKNIRGTDAFKGKE